MLSLFDFRLTIQMQFRRNFFFFSFFFFAFRYIIYTDCAIGVPKKFKRIAHSFVTGNDKSRFSQSRGMVRKREEQKVSRLCHFYRQSQYPRLVIASRNFSDLSSGRRSPPFRSRGLPHVNHTLRSKRSLYGMR